MGVDIAVWRARVGLYVHGKPKKSLIIRGLVVKKGVVSLALRVLAFALLLICQDVESNPGPTFTTEKDELLESLKEKCRDLEDKFQAMHQEMTGLVSDNKRLRELCAELEVRCESSEAQSRRENLLFHNLASKEGSEPETWEDSESIVREHLKNMGVDADQVKVERCHRLNPRKKGSPIIVKFSHFKDKEKILKHEKDKKKDRRKDNGRITRQTSRQVEQTGENQVYITEDFTQRVRKVRSLLRPYMEEAFQNQKKVRLSYDKLIIDNKVFWYDDVNKGLVDKKPAFLSCLHHKDN